MDKAFKLDEALFSAIENHSLAEVKRLLNLGASANSPSRTEPYYRPLEFAIDELEFGGGLDVVEELIKQGAKVNDWDIHQSTTPLHHATFTGNFQCVSLLLEHGADPNNASNEGDLPLAIAAEQGRFSIVKLLLDNGARKTINEIHGFSPHTPLNMAIRNLDIEMVKILLDYGADPKLITEEQTPLDFLPKKTEANSYKIDEVTHIIFQHTAHSN